MSVSVARSTSSSSRELSPRVRLGGSPFEWEVREYAEIAVAVALAAALSWLAQLLPLRMPQGGSVGFEMLPIIFIAVRRGLLPGVVAGGLFGGLQLLGVGGAPYIYHPLQAALDYPLAFVALGLAALIPVYTVRGRHGAIRLAAAVSLAAAARLVFHFLSALLFFTEYAPEWEAPWLYAITYNLLYIVPSAIVTAIVLWPLLNAYDAAFPSAERVPRP